MRSASTGMWRLLMLVATLSAGAIAVIGSVHAGGKHRRAEPLEPGPLSASEAGQAATLYAGKCAACHGPRLEGGVGPSLARLGSRYSVAKIARIAQNGKGRKKPVPMPAGLATSDEARLLARWLAGSPDAD